MRIWKKLKRRLSAGSTAGRAMAFVDYEHWFYSYKQTFCIAPDPIGWRKELEEAYALEDIMVFADFSYNGINAEISKLRAITNTIIETQQTNGRHKKDMTDFIMLDYIYQTSALHPEIGTYILFTGDGHFQSVAKYLTQRLKKQVIIYGVKGAISSQLKAIATEVHELPGTAEQTKALYGMIVSNMAYVSENDDIIPTFRGTVSAVSRRYQQPEDLVTAALQEMLDQGLLYQKERRVDFNRKVRIIAANWEALEKNGLWSFE